MIYICLYKRLQLLITYSEVISIFSFLSFVFSCILRQIYIYYQCFHRVSLTLYTVTSINSRQLKNKLQLETGKQDGSCQKTQDPNNKKSVLWKNLLMNHLKVKLILLLKNISSEIIHADVVVNAMNDEVSSICSKIVE